MSETLRLVQSLVSERKIKVSAHGARELAEDALLLEEIATGAGDAIVVEDYPTDFKGPSVLVRQKDEKGQLIHVLWGLAKGQSSPAVLVTAYRPDPERWSPDFLRRKK